MKRLLKKISGVIIVLLSCLPMSAGEAISASNRQLINMLDSVLARQEDILSKKEDLIEDLKIRLDIARNPQKRLFLMREIYSEYKKYDADSAIAYAERIKNLRKELPEQENSLDAESKIYRANVYSTQGLFGTSENLLREVNVSELSQDLKVEYYKAFISLFTLKAMFLSTKGSYDPEILVETEQYMDSLQRVADSRTVDDYLWMRVALPLIIQDRDIEKNDVERIKKEIKTATRPTYANSLNAYWLSKYYDSLGNDEESLRYSIIGAITDVMLANRDIGSFKELGQKMLADGNTEMAYNYLTYALQQANSYHNRNRMIRLSMVLPDLLQAYRDVSSSRDRGFRGFIIALSLLAFILIVAIIVVIAENKRKNVVSKTLEGVNKDLKVSIKEKEKAIESLEDAKKQLEKSEEIERNMLTFTIGIAAHYINMMDSFRKKLLKLYKSNKLREVEAQLNNEELSKEKYQEFYQDFDNVILSILPNLIADYNKQVEDMGKQNLVVEDSGQELNTRLRIYALQQLGIEKSGDQAKILNLSIRTVYNNRITTD